MAAKSSQHANADGVPTGDPLFIRLFPFGVAAFVAASVYSMFNVKEAVEFTQSWRFDGQSLSGRLECPLVGGLVYLGVISVLKRVMKDREPFRLYWLSLVHNVILVTLSLGMLVAMIVAAIQRVNTMGGDWFHALHCENEAEPLSGAFGFVIYIFYLSKYYELIDTVILALKKKPIIFLHISHHWMMLLITWSWLHGQWLAGSWWCVVVNSLVHTFMYYYYLRSTVGLDTWWKKNMTVGQLVQFSSGFAIVNYWLYIRSSAGCGGSLAVALFSHAANCMMICLFINFFIQTYYGKRSKSKKKSQ